MIGVTSFALSCRKECIACTHTYAPTVCSLVAQPAWPEFRRDCGVALLCILEQALSNMQRPVLASALCLATKTARFWLLQGRHPNDNSASVRGPAVFPILASTASLFPDAA